MTNEKIEKEKERKSLSPRNTGMLQDLTTILLIKDIFKLCEGESLNSKPSLLPVPQN